MEEITKEDIFKLISASAMQKIEYLFDSCFTIFFLQWQHMLLRLSMRGDDFKVISIITCCLFQ